MKKAYQPNTDKLNHLMELEADAAKNVNIRKGSEVDVIEKFASDKSAAEAGSSSKGSESKCCLYKPNTYNMMSDD